jgi:hypothetical protein
MWKDPFFVQKPLTKVLVIGVRKDPVRRRLWEDTFAGELTAHGVAATASYTLFPNALPDTQQAVEAIRTNGFDGVLVSRRLQPSANLQYMPGYTTSDPVTRYDAWANRYYFMYQEVDHPSYVDTEKVARHSVDVWTTGNGGRLVWSGTTETVDPTSPQMVQQNVVNTVISELSNQGIIPKGQ